MATKLTPEQAFASVLKELRTKRGLSQEELAHACDRHRTYISLLERAKHSPSLGLLFNLADALGTKPSEILRRVEAKLR
jgi:transcriptional regulator with XRE-family HTH domain